MNAKRLLPRFVKTALKRAYLRRKYNVIIDAGADVSFDTQFEGMNAIRRGCRIMRCRIGRGSYVSANSRLRGVDVGRFTSIGSDVKISLGVHPVSEFVSSHPAFFSLHETAGFTFATEAAFPEHKTVEGTSWNVVIGNDVWIGDNVLIMDGVEIGDGAVIGAGAIVTKSVEPYSINVGVPAHAIGMRFDADTVRALLELRWWDRDIAWLRGHHALFGSVRDLVATLRSSHQHPLTPSLPR